MKNCFPRSLSHVVSRTSTSSTELGVCSCKDPTSSGKKVADMPVLQMRVPRCGEWLKPACESEPWVQCQLLPVESGYLGTKHRASPGLLWDSGQSTSFSPSCLFSDIRGPGWMSSRTL